MRSSLLSRDQPLLLGGLLLLLAALLSVSNLLEPINRLFYDSIIRHAGGAPPEDIIIVSIDQKSLSALGRWPWQRSRHSQLLEQLSLSKPKAIAFDVIFAEPDNQYPEDDTALAAAIKANGRVVLPILLEEASQGFSLRETKPLQSITDAAAALGHVDTEIDADGVVRSAFLMAGLDKPHWPTLALALAITGNADLPNPLPGERAASSPEFAGQNVWRRDHQILVPFSGPAGHIRQVSFVDVVNGKVSPAEFTNRYVLVGVTAAGLGDHIPTPVSALSRPLPGVEFNAHVLNSLLRHSYITITSDTSQLIWNLCITLLLLFLFYKIRSNYLPWILFSNTVVITTGCILLLTAFHNWYPPATLLSVLFIGFGLFNWRYLKRLLKKLFMTRMESQTTINTALESIIKTTDEGVIIEVNKSAEQLLGMESDEAKNRQFTEVLELRRDSFSPRLNIDDIFSERFQQIGEKLILTNWHREKMPVRLNYTVIPVPEGEAKRNILIVSDLSREEQLGTKLKHQSTHNPISGLPNEVLFQNILLEKVNHAKPINKKLAVIRINLDDFRQINQTYGNDQGNKVIKAIAKRLGKLRNYETTLAHLGADEFSIVVEGVLTQGALTNLIKQIQIGITHPIKLMDSEISVSACIGISLFPDDNMRADLLIRQADIAVQRAKKSGAGNVAYFSQGMLIQAARKVELQQLIQQCIASQKLVTLYQPIVNAEDGEIMAVEALMRIPDQNGDYVSPFEFIPLAEKTGLIADLGKIQIQQACRHVLLWSQMNIPALRLSLNLSPRQLLHGKLMSEIRNIILSENFPATEIEFEITENLLLEQEEHIFTLFKEFQQLGVKFSLDDFGTGYNSMVYLRSGVFDRLKIDRSFVQDLGKKAGANVITASIIDMAHNLGMQVIAEGVETAEQRDILCRQGCDELQGYYFSKPLHMDAFIEYYQSSNH